MKRGVVGILIVCLVVPAVAYAATVVCNGGTCKGTNQPDQIKGSSERDVIYAKAGGDVIDASGTPNDGDEIHAGSGDDTIVSADSGSKPDKDYCGRGTDTVIVDLNDKLYGCDKIRFP